MKEYLKEIFTSVSDIMLKMILNLQVSKKFNLHYTYFFYKKPVYKKLEAAAP